MRVRVLGPVEASVEGRPVPLGAAKQRALLAMLAVHANHSVSADTLMEGLWGEHPPASAPKMVQQYVSQLRKLLGGAQNGDSVGILTRGRGYELRIAPDDVDARQFERLVVEGAAREALALWRGPPLADVADEPFAAGEIRRLEELRLSALEQAIEADLADGRHHELVGELEALVAAHPLSERLHAQLMLALYRAGRQAEALEAYRHARVTLVEQIGVEPGPQLRRLHEAILRQDASLELPGPVQLPPELEATSPLLGRASELERLHAAWARARDGHGAVVVVSGPAGIGRTRLAAELAGHVYRQGALVLYGADAVVRARGARRPTLLVLDDIDGAHAGATALGQLASALAARPVLCVVTSADAGLADQLAGAQHLELGPLAADAIAAIARLYAPDGAEIPAAKLTARSGGMPKRAHWLAAEWARAEAARRLSAEADRTAAERSDLRRAERQLVGTVVELQAARGRAELQEADRVTIVCPYKGLAAFERADAEFFFGRERLVAEMVARLVGAPLLGVVGASGSGKSSAVRAGLLAELAGGVLPGSERWTQVLLRPSEHPMRTLEEATADVEPHGRLLIAVDQFEESFTLCRDEAERAAFVDALVAATEDPRRRAAVVLAVRADFYGRCAAYPELSALLGANQVLVGPMQRDEVRRAVELPAQRAGLRVEPELVDRLLTEVEGEPGALPLLSSALLELWQRRDRRQLRLAAYEHTGGVHGAVARLAEAAYERLDPQQQAVARSILLRLAGEHAAGGAVRRRVALEELDADRADDVRRVLDGLAASRLVTISDGTVEVAHEALLREWPRLRGWLEEDAEGRRLHRHVAAAAREWDAGARDPGELYRGARLASALDWSAEHAAELNAVEHAFIAASRDESEREALRNQRTNRRLRALLGGVAALLLLAVIAGGLFLHQRGQARSEARTAQAQRLGAQALVEPDLDRSLLLARQGVAIEDSLQTRSNLLAALLRSPAAIGVVHIPGSRLLRMALRPDGRALVAGDNHGKLVFLDPVTRRSLRAPYRPQPFPILALAFSPDGSRLAIGGQGMVQLLDGHTFRRVASPRVPDYEFANMAFSPDARVLVATATSTSTAAIRPVPSTLLRFDARTGRRLGRPAVIAAPGALADVLAFSPDGRRLITATGGTLFAPETRAVVSEGERAIVVRDAHTLRPLRRFPAVTYAGAVSPDARTFAIGGEDGSVHFLDLRTGARRTASGRHAGAVQGAIFTRDGRFLVTVGNDGSAIVWDVEAAAAAETLTGHAGRALAAAVDHSAHTLYTAGLDGSVITWDLVGNRRLGRPFDAGTGSGDFFPSTAISSDGRTLVTTQDDGSLSVVDTATLTHRTLRIDGRRSPLAAAAFGPRGTLVASGADGLLALVDIRTGHPRAYLRGHHDLVFTPTTSAGGRIVASTGLDETLRLWDARRARPLGAAIQLPSAPTSDAGISPDGTTVAVSLAAGTVDVFDTRSRRRLARLRIDQSNPTLSHFSRDGRLLLTGSKDGRVRVFSAHDWRPLGPAFLAHAGSVSSVDASPDGRTLVTAGSDGQIRLWDLASRRPIGTPLPGPENINAVALFTPDGTQVFAIFRNGRGYRWDIRPTSWQHQACSVAGRRLTHAEWHDALPDRDYAPAC